MILASSFLGWESAAYFPHQRGRWKWKNWFQRILTANLKPVFETTQLPDGKLNVS
jgi:hypothetical protein